MDSINQAIAKTLMTTLPKFLADKMEAGEDGSLTGADGTCYTFVYTREEFEETLKSALAEYLKTPTKATTKTGKPRGSKKGQYKNKTTGYFLYGKEHRPAIKAQIEAGELKKTLKEIPAVLGAQWKALSDEEKKEWNDMAKQQNDENGVPISEAEKRSSQPKTTNAFLEYAKFQREQDSNLKVADIQAMWKEESDELKKEYKEHADEVNKENGVARPSKKATASATKAQPQAKAPTKPQTKAPPKPQAKAPRKTKVPPKVEETVDEEEADETAEVEVEAEETEAEVEAEETAEETVEKKQTPRSRVLSQFASRRPPPRPTRK